MAFLLTVIGVVYAAIGVLLWYIDHRMQRRGGVYALVLGLPGAWASTCGTLLGTGWLVVLGLAMAGTAAVAIHRARTRPGAHWTCRPGWRNSEPR